MAASGALLTGLLSTAPWQAAQALPSAALAPDHAAVVQHWTPQRRELAIPRDLVIDSRGLGYLRGRDGTLTPYGHRVAAEASGSSPRKGPPSGGGDTTPPLISAMDPYDGAVIGASHTFSATVTDESGVKSVSFVIQYPDGVTTQTFSASQAGADTWSVSLQGFSDGGWTWWVEAKDAAPRGGNTATSAKAAFTVDAGGDSTSGGSTGSETVANARWTGGGPVQTAAGRIYFEMPSNQKRKGPWTGYVCSGTVVTDETSERSTILTAAHCIYDDVNKAFARNVLLIPDQDGTTGSGTDLNCSNDPLGCWVPSFGVVDIEWTQATFPDNIPWDYGFYVVSDQGAHEGTTSTSDALDAEAGSLPVSFSKPYADDGVPGADSVDFTHAFGYSYSDDPDFMYCAEDMTTEGAWNWWLPSCGLSGGSSGGPWMQRMDDGVESVMSVNSWGYTNSPGMAGPRLNGTSAECLFTQAKMTDFRSVLSTDGDAGIAQPCPYPYP